MLLLRPLKAIFHADPLLWCSPPPPHHPFFIPQPSHPLSTPLPPTIPLSPHRPTLNRLLWNLFKYFDISPPLTSRAEMICDSWRWVRSEELPLTPCLLFFSFSVLLCRRADFSLSTPHLFFPSLFTTAPVSWHRPWKPLTQFFFFFMWLHSVIDKLGDILLFVDILCLLSLFVPFAQCPPTVWSWADTMYW